MTDQGFINYLVQVGTDHSKSGMDATAEDYLESVKRFRKLRKVFKLLHEALTAASDHLDYCGYGDEWERECAEGDKLPTKIETALALSSELTKEEE